MKSNKKILLLGGSAQQVIAIKSAKELGYYTVLCDYLPDNPGQYIADKFYQKSTTDIDAVYEIAVKENVDGILAYASDPAALPAAIVCERLGLPSNPVKSVEILGLKHPWRKFLKENGFACPKAKTFTPSISLEEFSILTCDFKYPIVIKPTDSSGSKGVSVLNESDDITKAVKWAESYSRNKVLIVEEYIKRGFPYVIGGDIFVWNNEVVLFGEMSCLRDNKNAPLVPIGEMMPSGLNDNQVQKIHYEIQKIIKVLGIQFGEMNIEILLDNDNNVHFLELGPRAGGNMIPVQLSDVFGIDLIKANVQAALGIEPDFLKNPIKKNNGAFMHYVLHSFESGIFRGLYVDDSIKNNIYREVIYKQEGDSIDFFDGAGKAIGIIFLKFRNIEEMRFFCDNHNNLIKILLDK